MSYYVLLAIGRPIGGALLTFVAARRDLRNGATRGKVALAILISCAILVLGGRYLVFRD